MHLGVNVCRLPLRSQDTIALLGMIVVLLSCTGRASRSSNAKPPLTEEQALLYAVTLANEECSEMFSAAPFDIACYRIRYRRGMWQWGEMDPHGIDGYSAVVSFDKTGGHVSVEVFLSTDAVERTRKRGR